MSLLEDPEEILKNLSLDLDDDLFWYSYFGEISEINSNNSQNFDIEIKEVYRIHDDNEMTLSVYGNWSNEIGLSIVPDEKWNRRRDLQV